MDRFALYFHSGSSNHGCEALVRSTSAMIKEKNKDVNIKLYTFNKDEDVAADISELDEIEQFRFNEGIRIPKISYKRLKLALLSRKSQVRADEYFYSLSCKNKTLKENDVYLSIGGDNYCYGDVSPIIALNKELKKLNKKIVLWGCSIGQEDITPQKSEDLKNYDLITARESITYNNLKNLGLEKNIKLCADPAFVMNTEFLPLPKGFAQNNTIGVNISPLITNFESSENKGVGIRSVKKLIEYIIENTDYQIALIPHVLSEHSNDYIPLSELYEEYKHTGRMVLISSQLNAMQIKGYIARCRAFVGARTHATIAAYSSNVPTLVLGYSVKSKGIAKDIFGSEEGLVLPIQELTDDCKLTNCFKEILQNEEAHRQKLSEVMPKYKLRAKSAVDYLFDIL